MTIVKLSDVLHHNKDGTESLAEITINIDLN